MPATSLTRAWVTGYWLWMADKGRVRESKAREPRERRPPAFFFFSSHHSPTSSLASSAPPFPKQSQSQSHSQVLAPAPVFHTPGFRPSGHPSWPPSYRQVHGVRSIAVSYGDWAPSCQGIKRDLVESERRPNDEYVYLPIPIGFPQLRQVAGDPGSTLTPRARSLTPTPAKDQHQHQRCGQRQPQHPRPKETQPAHPSCQLAKLKLYRPSVPGSAISHEVLDGLD